MSRDISSRRLMRLNNLCSFLGSNTELGKATPLHAVISRVGYDEGIKEKKSKMRQLQRDLQFIEMSRSARLIRDMKNNTLMLEPAGATDGDMSDIGESW